MGKKTSNKATKKPGEKNTRHRPSEPRPKKAAAAAATDRESRSAALAKPEIKKIQGLLKSKKADGIELGLSLLESLGATRADYEAVFTDTVKQAVSPIVNEWLQAPRSGRGAARQGRDASRAEYVRYHTAVLRPAFLAAWGPAAGSKKPFIDLVDIPAGSFTMGTDCDSPYYKLYDELRSLDPFEYEDFDENQVQVRITKPFRMGRTVVTQRQWREVMGTEPWRQERLNKNQCGDDFPAVCVSWDDAVLFCQTLTDLDRETGRLTAMQSYRLPTEAEWEYACRAGTTTEYSFGDDPELLDEHGWHHGNSGERLHRVAEKKPNPLGLFDMHGLVREWCADWYTTSLAGGDDPVGPAAGSDRVSRGGYWHFDASDCRSAYRSFFDRSYRYDGSGFRVVVLR